MHMETFMDLLQLSNKDPALKYPRPLNYFLGMEVLHCA